MSSISELEFFVVVAEECSFSAAAARLGVSRSYVSRVVAALEARLGVRVFQRTTRRVELTRAGALLLDDIAPLLAGLDRAQARVVEAAQLIRGPIRVSVPDGFGERYLTPVLLDFGHRYPDVHLTVEYSEQKVDLVAQRVDLAVRGGRMDPSSLIARRLCSFRVPLLASPEYLQRHGTPATVADLERHRCIRYLGNPQPDRWTLTVDGEPVSVPVQGGFDTSSSRAAVEAAAAGLGIARQPEFQAVEHLRSGALVEVLPEATRGEEAMWIVFPDRAHMPLRVATLIEHLVEAARGWTWARDLPGG